MTGEQLARLMKANNWTPKQMAEMLNAALERKYNPARISEWQRGGRPIPEPVSLFLTELGLEQILPDGPGEPPGEEEGLFAPPGAEDTAPGGGPSAPKPQQALTSSSGVYTRVCTEMWELVATAVGMVGAVTGSERLQADGVIIDADKEALGKAYGKLAETNETFRRMLTGMTTSGAWLEVALTTGITAGKVMRNHQPRMVEQTTGETDGGGNVVSFAHPAG